MQAAADPLLQCLVFLSSHFGVAKSAESIRAGLAYDEKGMMPKLFCEAAARTGLKTRIVKRPSLAQISASTLPAVIILNGDGACVLLEMTGARAKIFSPDTAAAREASLSDLQKDYSGYAILVHPEVNYAAAGGELAPADRHWFWDLVSENKDIYGMAVLAGLFINIFALVSPLFIMNVYDRVIPNNAIETGWALGIGALTVFVFDFIMRTLRAYLIDIAGRKIDVIAARRIYDQALDMRLEKRPKSSGQFANMLRDFDSIREFFNSATVTGLVDLPFSLLFLFVIYKIGGGIAIILVALMMLVLAFGYLIQIKLKAAVGKATTTAESKHGLLVETIHGLETVKAIGADGRFRARYTDLVGENAEQSQISRFWSGMGVNIATFLQQIASIIVVLAGMYMVRDGNLSMGALIACVILGGRAIAPIGSIANLMTRYHQAGGALKTLNRVMAQPIERPRERKFLHRPDLSGKITFDKVSFAYPELSRKALEGISFSIGAGEKVGIIGRIGSGKSTLARLVMGLYQPQEGSILADDTDYRQIDPADLRRKIAYIAQDVFLFSGSVRDNIIASVPQATEEEILKAAKDSGAHDFISRHPMGYDAPVGENGVNLSGGQRQAIALARAMLLRPRVMICDEPTNAMDVQAEESFKKYIAEEIKDKTFVLITHKTAMLPMVNRLVLLDRGRLIMDGPRDEVLAKLASGKIEAPA